MVISRFYHDNVDGNPYKSQVLLVTFYLWFVVEVPEVATPAWRSAFRGCCGEQAGKIACCVFGQST